MPRENCDVPREHWDLYHVTSRLELLTISHTGPIVFLFVHVAIRKMWRCMGQQESEKIKQKSDE